MSLAIAAIISIGGARAQEAAPLDLSGLDRPALRGSLDEAEEPFGADDKGFSETELVAEADDEVAAEPAAPVPPLRRTVTPEEDFYAPLGLQAGGFLLYPAITFELGTSDNLDREAGGRSGSFGRVTPELSLQSQWSRHSFQADIRGSLDRDEEGDEVDGPTLDADLRGRIDIRSDLTLDLAASYSQERESAVEAELPTDIVGRPEVRNWSGSALLSKRFNRLILSAGAGVSRYEVDDARLVDGSVLDTSDRAYDTYEWRLRAAYEMSPRLTPFVELVGDERVYDETFDSNCLCRGSIGFSMIGGAAFELTGKLSGELALGYERRDPNDPLLEDLGGLIGRGSLVWTATPLTTVRLEADAALTETLLTGSSGAEERSIALAVEHALRRHVLLTGRAGFSREDFSGIDRVDEERSVSLELIYKLSRVAWLTATAEHEVFDSTEPGFDYSANTFRIGLRLQR